MVTRVKVQRMAKPLPLSESAIQKQILEYLAIRHVPASITNADRTWGKGGGVRASKVPKGHPDITAVLSVSLPVDGSNVVKLGLGFYIEVKTAIGTVKPEQKESLRRLQAAGAVCVLARSVGDVIRIVEKLANKPYSQQAIDEIKAVLEISLTETPATARKQIQDLTEGGG